ncbi:MAG: dihydrofolate reductase, partial [Bacteroidales bacterium]|nr:dihydrofolate reductase [Bacteroidales bacterium]
MKILVTYQIPRDPFLNLPKAWEIVFPEEGKECFTEEEIIERIPDCEVLLSIFSRPVSNAGIEAGKKLRLISNFGVGFNNIDIAYARS